MQEIESSMDLELLINDLPDELKDAADNDLGNPNVMSPSSVQSWIRYKKNALN